MKYTLTTLTLCSALLCASASPLVSRQDDDALFYDYYCGSVGYDDGKASFWYSTDPTDGTYNGCYAQCTQHSECKSFSFDPESTECNLYNVRVNETFTAVGGSPYHYFDVGCQKMWQECGAQALQTYPVQFWYSNDATDSSCIAACLSYQNCTSCASGNGECFLYGLPVIALNLDSRTKMFQYYNHYSYSDRTCIDSSSASTTTSIMATTKAPTTLSVKSTGMSTSSTTVKTSTTIVPNKSSTTTANASTSASTTSKTKPLTSTSSTTTKTTVTTNSSTTKPATATAVSITNKSPSSMPTTTTKPTTNIANTTSKSSSAFSSSATTLMTTRATTTPIVYCS